jgi:hypothetical protein
MERNAGNKRNDVSDFNVTTRNVKDSEVKYGTFWAIKLSRTPVTLQLIIKLFVLL